LVVGRADGGQGTLFAEDDTSRKSKAES